MQHKFICLYKGALIHCSIDEVKNKVFIGNHIVGALKDGSQLNVIPVFRSVGIQDQLGSDIYEGHLLKLENKFTDALPQFSVLVMQVVWSDQHLCWMLSAPKNPDLYVFRLCEYVKNSFIIGHSACKYPSEDSDLMKNELVKAAIQKIRNSEVLNEKLS